MAPIRLILWLLQGLDEPLQRLATVLRHALAFFITQANVALPIGMPLLRRLGVPLERLSQVLCWASPRPRLAFVVAEP